MNTRSRTLTGFLLSFGFANFSFAQSLLFQAPKATPWKWRVRSDAGLQYFRESIQDFVSGAKSLVPAAIAEEFQSPKASTIEIQFSRDLGDELLPRCSSKGSLVALKGKVIFVNANAIEHPELLRQKSPCAYGTLGDHLYGETLNAILQIYYNDKVAQKTKHWIPRFSHLAGWTKRGLWIFSRYRPTNSNVDGMIEESEESTKQIWRTFGLYGEYYLLDPDFSCRRPAASAFLRDLFKVDGAPSSCQPRFELPFISQTLLTKPGTKASVTNLNPARIYQIHYLFAAKGPSYMSRWGHAMFRLIICAPETTFGPDCLNDLEYHSVVSFRANVVDLLISYWKGFRGGYSSQLFVYPFSQVINEYTLDELRTLESYPLKLSEGEKDNFIYRVLEMYWAYESRYYFITNNCATEAGTLLKAALDSELLHKKRIVSPLGFRKVLAKASLIDLEILKDRAAAEEKGYLLVSNLSGYAKSFEKIRAQLAIPERSIDEYQKKTTAMSRRSVYENALENGRIVSHDTPMKLMLIEKQIMHKLDHDFILMATARIAKGVERNDPKFSEFAALSKNWKQPRDPQTGYGIPMVGLEVKRAGDLDISAEQIKQLVAEGTRLVSEEFSKEYDEALDSVKNHQYFLAEMRRLRKSGDSNR